MNDIAGIVVHYGPFGMLHLCLGALVPQVRKTVVVNHGPDPVPAVLREGFREQVVWDEPGLNLGFSRGVNRALSQAANEFVLIVNPDTTVQPGTADLLVEFLRRNPRMGMAGPRLRNPDGGLQTSSYRLPTLVQLSGHLLGIAGRVPPGIKRILSKTPLSRAFGQLDPHTVEREVEMVSGACFVLRRRALADAGPFDPGFFLYYEEKDLCRRLWDAGWTVGFTPAATAEHVIGGSAPSRSALAHRHRSLSALRYFQRHGTPGQCTGTRALLAGYSLLAIARGGMAEHGAVLRASLSTRMACDSCS
ncbi:MAG: glycosyltransferase family 2 protein [Candidatus Eisenbacteria bacterium]|nr:glycosyltransferase family 2 protein [Candidatus Eisenbacteria bacterium]